MFRDPILPDEEYLRLYRGGSEQVWEPTRERADFKLVRQLLPDEPIDVLDIGCYTGQLLSGLPASCRRHGLEPNDAAAAKAAAHGVMIVGRHLHDLHPSLRYDIITALDVIEHVSNPREFLTLARAHLKPGGRIIVTTGNAQSWLWGLMRSKFWYCYFPEHISFIGPRWLFSGLGSTGLNVQKISRFSHEAPSGLIAQIRGLLMALLYAISPSTYLWLRGVVAPSGPNEPSPPGGGVTRDHLLCVLITADGEADATDLRLRYKRRPVGGHT